MNEFLKAPEPILVEVKRRNGPLISTEEKHSITSSLVNNFSSTTTTITEPTIPISQTNYSSSLSASSTKPLTNVASTTIIELRNETTVSVGVQTDLMPKFVNEHFGNNESPTNDGPPKHNHHLNSQTLPSCRNYIHQQQNHHYSHCTMLSDCIVPPDIDIEVITRMIEKQISKKNQTKKVKIL